MKAFGTFDTLTDEEDTIYNRLAVIRRELERLELEQNEAQQDIKMWRNKMLDDQFKVKFWLIAALLVAPGTLPWHLIVLSLMALGLDPGATRILNIIATFMALIQTFVFLPLFIVLMVVFLVWVALNMLRNSKKNKIQKLAENMGVQNRYVLIDEQKVIVGNAAKEMEQLKEEEEKLKRRLESIQRNKGNL